MEELSDLDKTIIANSLHTKTDKQISGMLGLPVDLIRQFINSFTAGTGMITKQMKVDAARAQGSPVIKNPGKYKAPMGKMFSENLKTEFSFEKKAKKEKPAQEESIPVLLPKKSERKHLKSDPVLQDLIERTNRSYETKVRERPPAVYGNPDWKKMYLDDETNES